MDSSCRPKKEPHDERTRQRHRQSPRRSPGRSPRGHSRRAPVTVIELRVNPDDLGKIIGRQGRTAKSIRTLLAAAGSKQHKRFTLEIVED